MRELDNLWMVVEMKPGANIPVSGIPDMIELANRTGATVKCKANGVTVMACPGDDAIDLAVAWELALKDAACPVAVAVAWSGRQHQIRAAAADSSTAARNQEKV